MFSISDLGLYSSRWRNSSFPAFLCITASQNMARTW